MIYLDYASTTPVDPRVVERMLHFLGPTSQFGNASATHRYGRSAAKAIEQARQQVAVLINSHPNAIIWTSGATEAINLALKGVMHFYRQRGRHLVTCKTEHPASLAVCHQLECEGFELSYLNVEKDGLLNLAELEAALKPSTILVSIMHVNNETGVAQDIDAIAQLVKSRGVFLHVDAAQSVGKLSLDLAKTPIDLLSLSAHKIYGPKGVGALYRRATVQLEPQIHGAGQQQGLRSGTLASHQIVGMGEACFLAQQHRSKEMLRIEQLRDLFWEGLQKLDHVQWHGHPSRRVAHILNIGFVGLKSDVLLPALRGLAVTTGSACQAGSLESSTILKAMGVSDTLAQGSIRFSLGRFTKQQEIVEAVEQIRQAVSFLRCL